MDVIYLANKTAWVTKEIFKKYLNIINCDLILQNPKILLFVDNCSAHKIENLSNIKTEFLPPNTTSIIHPKDQCIGYSFKQHYKSLSLNFLSDLDITKIDKKLKNYTIFKCIENVVLAWDKITVETILGGWSYIWNWNIRRIHLFT